MEQNKSYLLGSRRYSPAIEKRKQTRVINQNKEDVLTIGENIRNNNSIIRWMREDIRNLKEKAAGDAYAEIDYFDFENHFRGSREHVKQCQSQYLRYFENCKQVMDLGSGRGEFLELMKEQGIPATGVDIYEPFIALCTELGLHVIKEDALTYLQQCDFTDGIFASQLIEHLPFDKVLELCKTAYQKLTPGAYLILETPNPMSLAVFANSFYMDPSHVKPVHPLTLKYLVEKMGFSEVSLLFTEGSKMPYQIPALAAEHMENLTDFNNSMQSVEQMLFGSQDYALIAKK